MNRLPLWFRPQAAKIVALAVAVLLFLQEMLPASAAAGMAL